MPDDQQPATKQDIAELKQSVAETEVRLIEQMRDMQTEILRGMERFARGNFTRMHRLENSDNDLNERINVLEERIIALEVRVPLIPPPQS